MERRHACLALPSLWCRVLRYVTSAMDGAKACAANSPSDSRPSSCCATVASRSAFPYLRPELPNSTKSSASNAAIFAGERRTSGRKSASSSLCSSSASLALRAHCPAASVENFCCSPTLGLRRGKEPERRRSGGCFPSPAGLALGAGVGRGPRLDACRAYPRWPAPSAGPHGAGRAVAARSARITTSRTPRAVAEPRLLHHSMIA
jgi:hypothetical protein